MEILKVILLAALLMVFIMSGLAIQILLKKGGKFPNSHIGANMHMKARGITCVQTFDKIEQDKAKKDMHFKDLKLGN